METAQEKQNVTELLRSARVEVAPETFYLIGLRHEDWRRLLENPELSPRGDAPFMVLSDAHEVTLLLDETDWRTVRHAARDARVEGGFRLLTFDIVLGWDVIGFLARVTKILADAGIPVGALSAFSRDHLLIKQEVLGEALRILGEHVAELC
ncbi:MAG TPA: ACT domain-containing protein [Pyrinomonadaceae bacterium]|nr:ACT domain-containing protein [Pyrinomonadaceae bacterium]